MATSSTAEAMAELHIDRGQGARRRPRRRLVLALLLGVVALAVVLAVSRRAPSVQLAQVRQTRPAEAATELTASGYVSSERRSVIAPKIAGRLDRLQVQEGQKVQAGEVIARLDDSDERVQLAHAQAQVAAAQAQLAAAQANAIQAHDRFRRNEQLARAGALAQLDLEALRAQDRAAAAAQRQARANLLAAQRLEAAARLRLDDTVIRAPFTGTVARKLADEGAVLAPAALDQPNVGGIVELVDLGALAVDAEVSEDQLRKVRPGQPALVTLEAYPDKVFRAHVGRIRPEIDRSKGTAVVKVEFDQPPEGVLPDMAAKASFLSRPLEPGDLAESRRVPSSAVVRREGRTVVFTVENGHARAVPVKVGAAVGSERELLEGPGPGSEVVVSPQKLKPGEKVQVQR